MRALATAVAACEAVSTSTSSSSAVNSGPVCLSLRKNVADPHPAMAHRRPLEGLDGHPSVEEPSEAIWAGMSATRKGDDRSRIASKARKPSDHSATCRVSSGVKPERTVCSS